MISGVSSSYSSLYSASTSTTKVDSQKFQEQLLSSLDTDGDGKVSSDELKTALSSSDGDSPQSGVLVSLSQAFSDLDSDGDNGLSLDELSAMAPPPPPPGGPDTTAADELLSALDSDGDGGVSTDELSSALASTGSSEDSSTVFSALDTNQDGSVSADELAAAMAPPAPPELQQQAVGNTSDGTNGTQQIAAQALDKMIANLSKQYQLQQGTSVGSQVSVAA